MAKPIELMPVPRDAREELKRRLDAAPLEHADAVLDGYELLQELHASGTLDVLRGLLGSGDQVVKHAVGIAAQPESVRALRNLLVLGKLLGSIDPAVLHSAVGGISPAMEQSTEEPPSLFAILRRFRSKRSRRALAAGAAVLEGLGAGLEPGPSKS